jgi:hypothetical protein
MTDDDLPISREEIDSIIEEALVAFDDDVRAEWQRMRIEPALWHRRSRGGDGERSWAIAIDEGLVLWFDESHDSFSWNELESHGVIEDAYSSDLDFGTILYRIAQRQNEAALARAVEGDVPADGVGPGTITRTQPFRWDVCVGSLAYRVHFRDVYETCVAETAFATMEIVAEHPLLARYREPSRALYFYGAVSDPLRVANEIEATLRELSSGWRGLRDIEDVVRRLRGRHGLLMETSKSVSDTVEAVLARHDVTTSALGGDVVSEQPARRVLVLGRNAVVAGGFAFERR